MQEHLRAHLQTRKQPQVLQRFFSKIQWKVSNILKTWYTKILEGLDSTSISPNRLVTLRTVTAISVAGILTLNDNLWMLAEYGLLTVWALALISDKIDGDLARYTHQTSVEGEVYDALADKITVYSILALIWTQASAESHYLILLLLTWMSFSLDAFSQSLRGKYNIQALRSFWMKPLSTEQRQKNTQKQQTQNAANIYGKLKTCAVMSAVWVGVQDVLPLSEESKITIANCLLTSGIILSWASLYNKFR